MANGVLTTNTYDAPPLDIGEILRYAGCPKDTGMSDILDGCISELAPRLSYKVCWRRFDICKTANGFDLGFAKTDSRHLHRALCDCESIIVFAATVGLEPDRLIARYGRLSPTKSLFFQAIGAERIEALCDAFSADMHAALATESKYLGMRFSPGYGDLSLSLQRDIFSVLDCQRRIGLTLNDSLVMSPTKSVTAIAGISAAKPDAISKKCQNCDKENCAFRRL